jgi:hypothetical protein
MNIDCVLPIVEKDFDRFLNLRACLDKFNNLDGDIHIILSDNQIEKARPLFTGKQKYIIHSENSIIESHNKLDGWWKQQLIKMAMYEFVKTDFYLTLDCDVLIVQPLTIDKLINNNKGIVEYVSWRDWQIEYYRFCKKLMQFNCQPMNHVNVTPFLFNRNLMKFVIDQIKIKATNQSWQSYLANNVGWTEYSLYYSIAWKEKEWDKYHVCRPDRYSWFGNCVWKKPTWDNWKASNSFNQSIFLYTIIQSNTGIAGNEIWERIKSYV